MNFLRKAWAWMKVLFSPRAQAVAMATVGVAMVVAVTAAPQVTGVVMAIATVAVYFVTAAFLFFAGVGNFIRSLKKEVAL
jgi:hypothetical protein